MSDSEAIVVLRHGTTLRRAERLLVFPPDAMFVEPGGDQYSRANGFSAVVAGEADIGLGLAEGYARAKARNFLSEGGPVILEVEVPERIVDILRNDPFASWVVESHEIRFEPDLGLAELQQAWPTLTKRIVRL